MEPDEKREVSTRSQPFTITIVIRRTAVDVHRIVAPDAAAFCLAHTVTVSLEGGVELSVAIWLIILLALIVSHEERSASRKAMAGNHFAKGSGWHLAPAQSGWRFRRNCPTKIPHGERPQIPSKALLRAIATVRSTIAMASHGCNGPRLATVT